MADAKRSKSSVGYKRGGDHCGVCKHFVESAEDEKTETGACELVQGEIGEDMWCRLFARKPRTLAGGGEYRS